MADMTDAERARRKELMEMSDARWVRRCLDSVVAHARRARSAVTDEDRDRELEEVENQAAGALWRLDCLMTSVEKTENQARETVSMLEKIGARW